VLVTAAEVQPDDEVLRVARRARVLAEMEAAGIDILVMGREANARYVSGAPRLWLAGSRAFGVSCVLVRSTGAVHLLSTWDEGVPDDIPHEHLYGISFNSKSFLRALQRIEGAETARTVGTDAMTAGAARLLPKVFPSAELVDAGPLLRRCRQVKMADEVDAIRSSLDVAERALAAVDAALEVGVSERHLTGVFMEEMARAGVTTPSNQDVAWITSREHRWRRTDRDAPVAAGDLVVLEAGVIGGGYVSELTRTRLVRGASDGGAAADDLFRRADALWDRLLPACRPGAPMSDLLGAYDAAGEPHPPMPVARGLGLGYDLPLVTASLPQTAAEQQFEVGMVFSLAAYVWQQGVGGVYQQDPVVITESGPAVLSTEPFRNEARHA
jgi:Xaa-Pro aminopeptidase